jgi:ComF family protein
MIAALIDFLFPRLCLGCASLLEKYEKYACLICQHNAAQTDFHLLENNKLKIQFNGLIPLEYAFAQFYYKKDTLIKKYIHQLKYNKQEKIGEILAKWYAIYLKDNLFIKDIDLILAVPIHKKRKQERGYNQVHLYIKTLSKELNIPYDFTTLKRIKNTNTQTKKDKKNRFEIVFGAFKLNTINNLNGKHILLIDDVITTGATLEACWEVLKEVPQLKISILSIAYADS